MTSLGRHKFQTTMGAFKLISLVCAIYACFTSARVSNLSTPPATTEDYLEHLTTEDAPTDSRIETAHDEMTETSEQILMEQFLHLHESACGFIQLCTLSTQPSTAPPHNQQHDPAACCLPCSCDDSCQTEGTCCPDYDMLTLLNNVTFGNNVTDFLLAYGSVNRGDIDRGKYPSNGNSLESGQDEQVVGRMEDSSGGFGDLNNTEFDDATTIPECDRLQLSPVHSLSPPGQDYKVVKSCPSQFSDERIRLLCETSSSSKMLIPVYSRQTGKPYKNSYCLQCNMFNDMTDTLLWQPVLVCKFFSFPHIYFRNIDSVAQFASQSKRCNVVFKPPDDVSIHVEQCILAAENSCPIPGKNDSRANEGDHLPQMCSLFYSPITQTYPDRRTFRNIACYYCNRETFIEYFAQSCWDQHRTWPTLSIYIYVPTTAMHDDWSKESGDSLDAVFDSTGTCPQGYMYYGACRKVLCQRDFSIVDGGCVPLYGRTTGLAFRSTLCRPPLIESGGCRKVLCQRGFSIVDGGCVPMYGRTTGLAFRSTLVVHVSDETRQSTNSQHIADIIDRAFTDITTTAQGIHVINLSFGIFEKENGIFYIPFRFTCEDKTCYYPATLRYVKDVAEKVSRLQLTKKTVLESTIYEKQGNERMLYDLATRKKLVVRKPFVDNYIQEIVIPISKASFCYRIQLEQNEIELSFLFATVTTTASKVRVSYDDIDSDDYSASPTIICMDMMRHQRGINVRQTPANEEDVGVSLGTPTRRENEDQIDQLSEKVENGLAVIGAILGLVIVVIIVRMVAKRSISAAS